MPSHFQSRLTHMPLAHWKLKASHFFSNSGCVAGGDIHTGTSTPIFHSLFVLFNKGSQERQGEDIKGGCGLQKTGHELKCSELTATGVSRVFVRAVGAVLGPVAHQRLEETLSSVFAHKLHVARAQWICQNTHTHTMFFEVYTRHDNKSPCCS